MLMLAALSLAAAPAAESPAHRFEPGTTASFTASVTIRHAVGAGRDVAPPPWSHSKRTTELPDAAGQPHPALILDFE